MRLEKIRLHECAIKDQFSDRIRVVFYLTLVIGLFAFTGFIGNDGLRQAVVVGGFVGLATHWMMTRRCFLVLDDGTKLKTAINSLSRMKYAVYGNSNHYRLTIQRWMFFNHQDIDIYENGRMFTITGPRLVLKIIVKKITDASA